MHETVRYALSKLRHEADLSRYSAEQVLSKIVPRDSNKDLITYWEHVRESEASDVRVYDRLLDYLGDIS